MVIVKMNNDGPVTNGLAELNHRVQDEHKEIRDGVTGEGQGLSEEDELRINKDVEDVNDGQVEAVHVQEHVQTVLQRPEQHLQGPLVRWESFLPFRSLKVLLVENDDSTRHIVYALLRNCGYEVTAVANGLQAWKILEDLTNHIDLVLTEVVTPCLSGIGLLCKIMSHKTCKNIPVIMMSSHDSIGVVFKCLSKGAVDYLLKPIRKNELKTLWQHIWRKCHSSSCSGSESGIRTKKSSKSRSIEESDNNTGSNDEDDIGSIGLNIRDGSDNGSGTQSSWTKRAVEVDSPLRTSPTGPPDSTCAQVIHSRAEAFGNNWVPVSATKEYKGQNDEIDNVVMGKELKIGVPGIPNLQLEDPSEKVLSNRGGVNKDKLSEFNSQRDDEKLQKGLLELNSEKPKGYSSNQAAEKKIVIFNIPNGLSEVSNMKEKTIYETKEIASLELSLKRLRDVEDTGTSTHKRSILRHSELSAFSRYNSASTANQAPIGNVGSCSALDNSSEAATNRNLQSNSASTPPNQRSNGSSNNTDMGSTTNNTFTKPMVLSDNLAPKSTVKCLHPSSAFQPVQNGHRSPPPPVIQGKADAAIANSMSAQERCGDRQIKVQHHHHHYHHHHHHVHNMPQEQQLASDDDDMNLKSMVTATPHCVSSNVLGAPIEGSAGNHSLNGSASGSNHGSSTALNTGGKNMESDYRIGGESGAGAGFGFPDRSGVDQNRFAHREAALNKFRQKRKERCFEKKVRYQSRKKLAEQRPRVRGQFVRQVVHEK